MKSFLRRYKMEDCMQRFERDFEEFCKTPGVESGKASSYVRAIRYLCDYMGIYEINEENLNKLRSMEDNINDKDSSFYQGLLGFLTARRQKSYLEGGFISAALKYLCDYKL